jgi:hypothetical protein
MLVLVFIIQSLMLTMTIAELMKTHQAYTPPYTTIAHTLPTTSAQYVAENHRRINRIPLSMPCGKQLKARQCLANEIHQNVEVHNPEDNVDGVGISTSGDFQHNWKNRSN